MSTKIQLRRGLSTEWTSVNPLLASGEVGIETDTKQIKVGDGVTYWNSLAYSFVSEATAQDLIDVHASRTDNPHSVTKAQVGLSNVLNLAPANLPISNATQAALDLKYDASNPNSYVNAAGAASAAPVQSVAGKTGTVTLTKSDVGLSNVNNTSDLNKPISTATQAALDLKYDSSNPDGYVNTSEAAAAAPVQSVAGKVGAVTLTKSDVGLSNVDNVSAANLRDRSTHTGTQLAATISDFTTAAQSAVIVQTISNNDTTHSPSADAVHDALAAEEAARISIGNRVTDIENDYGVAGGLATLDGAGKISTSMLPGTVLEYKGVWNASTNTPTLQNGSGVNSTADAGHIYRVSVAGSVDFGSGSITFSVGDDVILSESLEWQRAPGGSLVVSVNGYQGDVVLDSEDIALTSTVASASNVQHALENIFTSVSDTMTNHTEALDPHPQYETSTEAQAKVDAHANLTNNPHSVTKAQVGLGDVDNTSDLDKPISTATQSALDLKYDASNPNNYVDASGAASAAPVQSVAGRTGAVVLTKTDVGLGSVDDVSAASLRDRSTHTGTQLASTISDFTTAVQAVTIDAAKIDGGVVSNAEFATLDGINTSVSIQSQINDKEPTITGAATTITSSNLTPSRALTSNVSGKVAVSTTTSTELGYVSGVTSAIQTQINNKEPTITAGTTSQYWRGDKSWQTLDKSAVGLGSVDNVSAASLRDRSTHTGTQLASTISDFDTAAQGAVGNILVDSTTVDFTYDIAGTISADVIDGSITNTKVASGIDAVKIGSGVVSNTEFATLDGIDTSQTIQTQISARDVAVLGYNLAGATGHVHTTPLTSIEAKGLMDGTLASVVKDSSLNAGHVHSTTITWDATSRLFLYSVALAAGHVHDVVAQQLSGTETTVNFTEVSEPAAPTVGLTTYADAVAGRQMLSQKPKAGKAYPFQPSLGSLSTQIWLPNANAATSTVWGQVAPTANGTATARTVATTNSFTWQRRVGYVSAGTANQSSGLRSAVLQFGTGNSAGTGGFFFQTRFGISDAALVANARSAVGLSATTAAFGNADPSTLLNFLGMAHDSADTNWQIMFNDGAGAATKVDLGANFTRSPAVSTVMYDLTLWCAPNTTTVYYEVKNLSNAAVATGTMTTNIPANTQLLTWQLWRQNGGTAAAVGIDIASVYIETEL